MRRNKLSILLIIPILLSNLCLCSFTDEGNVTLEWHAFRHATKIATGNDAGGLGHSFIKINNEIKSSVDIGYYTLQSNTYVTIGLWKNSALGSSSSGSHTSDFNKGILYNYERYHYTQIEIMNDDIYTSMVLSSSNIANLSSLVKSVNSKYSLVTYNCATFTTDVWNTLNGTNYWTGWNQTPSSVKDDIDDYTYYNGNNSLTYTSSIYYYNESKGSLMSLL